MNSVPRIRFLRGPGSKILKLAWGQPALDTDKHQLLVGDEQGVPRPVGGGASMEAKTVTLSGASGTIDLGILFIPSRFTSIAPGRFRLYRDKASRDNDAARQLGQKANSGSGLVLEIDASIKLSGLISPQESATPGDGDPAWLWTGYGDVVLEILSMGKS